MMNKIFHFGLSLLFLSILFMGCKKDKDTVALNTPDQLYIVGSATLGGTGIPVPDPEQKMEKAGAHSFETIVYLKGDENFQFISENESGKGKEYGMESGSNSSGELTANDGTPIPSVAEDGWYEIKVDFKKGSYTVSKYESNTDPDIIPKQLYIIGDAVASGWDNPIDESYLSDQTFTKVNAYLFVLTVELTGDKEYKLIKENGSWDYEIGVGDTEGIDPIDWIFAVKPQEDNTENIPSPHQTGTYKIKVNFLDYHYTLTKQ